MPRTNAKRGTPSRWTNKDMRLKRNRKLRGRKRRRRKR